MAKRQTTIEGVPRPRVGDPAFEGLSPRQRKIEAERRLEALRTAPTQEQLRAAEEAILLEEIRLAEKEQAQDALASQEPRIRQAVVAFAAHRKTLRAKQQSALQGMREAAAQAVVTEKALREAQERLSRAVEGRYRVRIDQSQGTPDQVRQLIMNLTLEADAEFRRRWKGLLEELETGEIWEGLSPGDDPLANVLHQGLMRAIHQEIGGRPLPFKRGR